MKTFSQSRFFLAVILVLLSLGTGFAQDLSKKFDELLAAQFPATGPGSVALVAKGDQILFRKAYGMANLELDVTMKPEHIFRIGSITKQFTAAAILKLQEAGKLSVQDDIHKYLPDYPTHGYKITIEHLLTHTSGIKSYTDMPEFESAVRQDKKSEDFISFFKNQPMDFAPGEKWQYNNSGYFLLGVIIEKVSGKPYDVYIRETFFEPLGMKNSFYGHNTPLIKNRVPGYSKTDGGFANSDYLSMDLPYAAGSLTSNVDDLYTWYKAVMNGKVLKPESLAAAHARFKLNNGKPTNYGYGWFLGDIQGSPTIEHNGGINGFLTASIYLPQEKVFVAVFSNCEGNSPDVVARKVAAVAMGKPFEWKKIALTATELGEYPGVYESEDGSETRTITLENGQLFSQRSGSRRFEIFSYAKDKFFFSESVTTLEFSRGKSGKVETLLVRDQMGVSPWKKSDKPIPVKTEMTLSPEVLQQYVGEYELQPNFILVFTLENGQLMTQATGQPKFPVFAEKEDQFFLKVVDAKIEFVKGAGGKIEKLILNQGGQRMEAKKRN